MLSLKINMYWLVFRCLWGIFFLVPCVSYAADVLEVQQAQQEYDLLDHLEIMRDTSTRLTWEHLRSGKFDDNFEALETISPALGQTNDAIWFRAQLHNPTGRTLAHYWMINYIFLENIDFYKVRDFPEAGVESEVQQLSLGKNYPYSARVIDFESYLFPFSLEPNETSTFYFRIKSSVPIFAPFRLVNDIGLAQYQSRYRTFLGLYVGIMLGMVFYNLFLFLATRETAYFFYVLFISAGCGAQLSLMGALDQLTPESITFNRMNGNLFTSVCLLAAVLFAQKMLDVKELSRPVRQIVGTAIVITLLCVVGALANIPGIHLPITFGVIFVSVGLLVLAAYRVCQGHQPARYFLGAWSVLTIGAVISSLLYAGLVPYNDFTVWSFPFCSGIEAALLSFSLAARLSLLRRQRHESEMLAQKALTESEAKGQFLAQMSHEIRTPMNGVLGMAELLKKTSLDQQQQQYLDIIDNSGKALLTIINDILDYSKIAAGKMQLEKIPFTLEKLVDDCLQMLSLPAVSKGIYIRAEWNLGIPAVLLGDPTRVRQILTNFLSNAYKFTEQGGVTLRVSGVEPATAGNNDHGNLIRFEVIDSGIGISQEAQLQLFKLFSQAEASTTRRFGGTGLGLAICRQLAELMGGEVGVYSEQGKGSTFWFTAELQLAESSELLQSSLQQIDALQHMKFGIVQQANELEPLLRRLDLKAVIRSDWTHCTKAFSVDPPHWTLGVVERREQLSNCLAALNSTQSPGRWIVFTAMGCDPTIEHALRDAGAVVVTQPVLLESSWEHLARITLELLKERNDITFSGHLLVAEDNVVNQKVITAMLKMLGVTCDIVENGKLAVEHVCQQPEKYSLVLMDCEMPEMNGYEAARSIRDYEEIYHLRRLPIIALSAHVMAEHLVQTKACGMDDALPKPLTIETLRESLVRYLAWK